MVLLLYFFFMSAVLDSMGHSILQIEADISVPSDPDLLERVLTRDQILAIVNSVGRDDLSRLAAVSHESNLEMSAGDYSAMAAREAEDLAVLREAVTTATGKEKVWVVGFAGDFARALLQYADQQ